MATAGILKPRDGAKTNFEPLLTTSTDAEEIPVEKVQGMPDVAGAARRLQVRGQDADLGGAHHRPGRHRLPRRAAQAGTPPTKDDEAAATDARSKPAAPQLKTAVQPINVIVVADTDILDDRFWVQVQEFIGQRVDRRRPPTMAISSPTPSTCWRAATISSGLRSRGTSARPFEVVEQIQRAADGASKRHETELEKKLKETQSKIKGLEGKESGQPNVTLAARADARRSTISASEMLRIRQQLRQVQLDQRQDLDRLKAKLEFFDIAAVPLLVGAAAGGLGILRLQRRKRRRADGMRERR